MIDPFLKYKGLEFFGTFEQAKGKADAEADDRTAVQLTGEPILGWAWKLSLQEWPENTRSY